MRTFAPFLPAFVAEQKEAFVTTPTGIKSKADLAMETHEKDCENLGDIPVEEDPSYRVLIADIGVHVPGAHSSRTVFKMKDASTATSLQKAKEDAATHGSLLQQVTTVTIPDADNFDWMRNWSPWIANALNTGPTAQHCRSPLQIQTDPLLMPF